MIAKILPHWLTHGTHDFSGILLSISVTLVLSLGVAALHRFTSRGSGHTQDYSHTLILIGVVTAVLAAVIGRHGHVGVAMFAAFSLVQFPANLRRSMDMAFMFFTIALAIVAGTGHYQQAVVVALLGGGLIYVLHRKNAFAPAHASHTLTVTLPGDADFEAVLSPVFSEHTASNTFLNSIPQIGKDMSLIRYGLVLKEETRLPAFIEALHSACGNERVHLETEQTEFDIER
ncbi:YrzE family protein [Haloferula sp. BvORR071]|uniref:YrzE family protein n=1 Tax=Haloferula sp. BvORR071 TaxID=1396141 RepID=UPI00055518C7|nr:YrzE family protein [Haloferula sp. BvORR071]